MARGATVYRAQVDLSDIDRDTYAAIDVTLAQHPSETLLRTVMRLLAYGLRYEPDLEFGRGVSATDEPDLWSREGDGRPRQWVEVGQPDAKRLVKAARQAERVTLFVFGEGAERYRASQIDGLKAPDNLHIARVDDAFLESVAGSTERQIRWALTRSDGIIYLTAGDLSLETTPEVWLGAPFR